MIAYINGEIAGITEDNVVVDVQGIGYNIKISSDTASRLPGVGERVRLHTYTWVREDAFSLYGFLTEDDLDIFKKCITVNGIGPKGALAILSVMDADSLRFAIISGDVKMISRAPGIGRKTAERLILDLKDKISMHDTKIGKEAELSGITDMDKTDTSQKREAIEALTALGYDRAEAMKAVNAIEGIESMDSGTVLKAALKKMV